MGILYFETCHAQEAANLLEEVLAGRTVAPREENENTSRSNYVGLAIAYDGLGRIEDSLRVYEKILYYRTR